MAGNLVDRLRGIYRTPITDGLGPMGGGEEPDNPQEYVRKFEGLPPIQGEAADHIEELREALIQCKRELWYCAQQAGFDWKIDGERRAKHPVSKAYDLATQILAAPD